MCPLFVSFIIIKNEEIDIQNEKLPENDKNNENIENKPLTTDIPKDEKIDIKNENKLDRD